MSCNCVVHFPNGRIKNIFNATQTTAKKIWNSEKNKVWINKIIVITRAHKQKQKQSWYQHWICRIICLECLDIHSKVIYLISIQWYCAIPENNGIAWDHTVLVHFSHKFSTKCRFHYLQVAFISFSLLSIQAFRIVNIPMGKNVTVVHILCTAYGGILLALYKMCKVFAHWDWNSGNQKRNLSKSWNSLCFVVSLQSIQSIQFFVDVFYVWCTCKSVYNDQNVSVGPFIWPLFFLSIVLLCGDRFSFHVFNLLSITISARGFFSSIFFSFCCFHSPSSISFVVWNRRFAIQFRKHLSGVYAQKHVWKVQWSQEKKTKVGEKK